VIVGPCQGRRVLSYLPFWTIVTRTLNSRDKLYPDSDGANPDEARQAPIAHSSLRMMSTGIESAATHPPDRAMSSSAILAAAIGGSCVRSQAEPPFGQVGLAACMVRAQELG